MTAPPAVDLAAALAALRAAGVLRGQPTTRPALDTGTGHGYRTGHCKRGTHERCPGLVSARIDPGAGRTWALPCSCPCEHAGQVRA